MKKFYLTNLNNGLSNGSGCALGVMPSRDDPIEELATLAELHDKINGLLVLVSLLEAHNIGMLRQMAHDFDLPSHILHVDLGPELALGYGLARQGLARLEIEALPGDAELAPAQLFPEPVFVVDVAAGGIAEDRNAPRPARRLGALFGCTVGVVLVPLEGTCF